MTYIIDMDNAYGPYELERTVSDGHYTIVRLDGRTFHNFTKNMEKPFDEKFMGIMVETMNYLVTHSGFRILIAETHSDEISLLISKDDETFNRRVNKIASILSSIASAFFTLNIGRQAIFDAKVFHTDNKASIVKYFLERYGDANRNFINGHAHWTVRKINEASGAQVESMLNGMSLKAMEEMLTTIFDVDLNKMPENQLGTLVRWTSYKKLGYNPITEEDVEADRNKIENRPSGPENIKFFLLEAIHEHHTENSDKGCESCMNSDGYCDYCKNTHMSEEVAA